MRVWLNPSHGQDLLALAADTGLELVWCTTWLHEANTRIGPAIGLPPLPVIEFPSVDLDACGSGWLWTGSWKWSAVARYAAGRPVAWLDDDLAGQQFAPARAMFETARAGTPTLLCHCDPRTGLLPEHLAQVRTWAATITNTAPASRADVTPLCQHPTPAAPAAFRPAARSPAHGPRRARRPRSSRP